MAVCRPTFVHVAVALTLFAVGYYSFTLYRMFHPPQCSQSAPQHCVTPFYGQNTKLGVRTNL